PGVLREPERADAAHVLRREAVPGGEDRAAAEPRDLDPDAAGEELDRRRRVVEEGHRVGLLVAPHGDDRREAPRVALDRHVVRRRDEDGVVEVRAVGELVQQLRELALRRREAHVDHVEALLDGPAQAGQQHRAAALEAGPEHARAEEAALRRELPDDPGAGGAVAAEVALAILLDLELAVLEPVARDRAVDLADARMSRLDAAVEDADADALAGRVAERPVARDLLRPVDPDRDALASPGGQAPGREVRRLLAHARIVGVRATGPSRGGA